MAKQSFRQCHDEDFDSIWSTINDAAVAYRGRIPADCLHHPYMSREELRSEISGGVQFWAFEDQGAVAAVMGLQSVKDVHLIRHAYVRTGRQHQGIGGQMLTELRRKTRGPLLVGTWAAATWAIQFYERNGFKLLDSAEKDRLLRLYWKVPDRQIQTSVVLADDRWFTEGRI